MSVLAVIPNDPLDSYEQAGLGSWLARYYNPQGLFARVYCLSPLERHEAERYGMLVIPTRPRQLRRRLRGLGVDVVRAYGGGWPAEVLAEAQGAGVPLVASVHASDSASLSDRVCAADFVFCTSRVVADTVRARGVPESRIRILPNRVDRRVFCPNAVDPKLAMLRARFPWRYGVLHVGRYAREKNLDTVISALAQLGPAYGLVSIGRGDASSYRQQAERLGIGERCAFLGPVPNDQLPSYYRWCACMCVPSRWEGFGIVFLEAMACAAVLVTSKIRPMTEYLQDDVNGVLVEAFEDPAAVASGIVRACTGPRLAALGAAAREGTQRFSVEVVDALEVNLYREVMAAGAGQTVSRAPLGWWGRLRGVRTW